MRDLSTYPMDPELLAIYDQEPFFCWLLEILQKSQNSTSENFQAKIVALEQWEYFKQSLLPKVNETGHVTDVVYWAYLRKLLIQVAALQEKTLDLGLNTSDSFHSYAELYDEIIGFPCLHEFMTGYIKFVVEKYKLDFSKASFLSIGCGTGIVEQHILRNYPIKKDQLLGIDISASMVIEANHRIPAKEMDFLALRAEDQQWDITYNGLNVLQYLPFRRLEEAIAKIGELTAKGGLFFGDFITSDHVRWYPHVMQAENVISLRQPVLVEKENYMFQQSEIINISKLDGTLRFTDEGKYLRYLPSMWKVRQLFERYFPAGVDFYDALSLECLPPDCESCPSTRYLVVARK
ncbi:MAG: hypothetical protein COB67_11620 [SAR324 cluster bacterium]|uniref:Methyltransferase domain-containing protein n=1 Tax=SAR324 cluster bacterium TaxID=2024889 RepID=A0A2A4ST70_9DELT|nr:MAG: hypothetical protein COB67_11620 [SAR324 cluster bacterium]